MGTITSRKRKDNSTAYTAQIRINRDGKTVYQESQAFDRKQVAQAWIKRRHDPDRYSGRYRDPRHPTSRGARSPVIWVCVVPVRCLLYGG